MKHPFKAGDRVMFTNPSILKDFPSAKGIQIVHRAWSTGVLPVVTLESGTSWYAIDVQLAERARTKVAPDV